MKKLEQKVFQRLRKPVEREILMGMVGGSYNETRIPERIVPLEGNKVRVDYLVKGSTDLDPECLPPWDQGMLHGRGNEYNFEYRCTMTYKIDKLGRARYADSNFPSSNKVFTFGRTE